MEKEIKLPRISEGADSGVVSDIYVKEGDHVEAEQSIIAVESDKATVDVPVEEEGEVKSIKVSEGDEVKAGDVLIVLETQGGNDAEKENGQQKKDKEKEAAAKEKSKPKKEKRKKKESDAKEAADRKDSGEEEESKAGDEDRRENDSRMEKEETADSSDIPAAPLAKKFARELGIDLSKLNADDPGQRITTQHVFEYARKIIHSRRQDGDIAPASIQMELPDFSKWGETERKPMSGIRRVVARNTVYSWTTIPHVTHFDKADVSSLEDFLKTKRESLDEKITVTALILKVACKALQIFPQFNASVDMNEKEVIYKKYFHIGVAVDTDQGLLMPVIQHVDQKSILALSRELSEKSDKARSGKLSSDEMQGGNFVVSNLGGIGGSAFTPVIFPPQVAILGVSRTDTEPVYNGSTFTPRRMLPLALSYDHRVIDGADAARFLRWICEALAQPMNLVMDG